MVRMISGEARVDGYPVVCSVWHSGTRTLVKWLHEATGVKPTHHHFLHYDRELRIHYGQRPDLVHIPVRHPMSIAESWARRSKPIEKLLGQFESMWAYLERYEPNLYCVEALPRLGGLHDHDVVRDKPLAAIPEYQQIIREEVVAPHSDFWAAYYTDPTSREDKELASEVCLEM